MANPPTWTQVYPYGTKEGEEEAKFFRALARSKYEYRSTAALIKETGLLRERVEDIIDKYVNKISPPLLFAHPTNDDHWAYWERVKDRVDVDKRDISTKDKDSRIDKHISGSPSMVGGIDVSSSPIMTSTFKASEDLMSRYTIEDISFGMANYWSTISVPAISYGDIIKFNYSITI